jgi:DNA-3-methyladenine glycosylase
VAYVFLIYGMHNNFNIVTGAEGMPHAVLIRAVEPLLGRATMARRRGVPPSSVQLTNGPGKLCQAFNITRDDTARDLCGRALPRIYLLDAPRVAAERSPRIGVDYAGSWAHKPWRFAIRGNPYVSKRPRARLGHP